MDHPGQPDHRTDEQLVESANAGGAAGADAFAALYRRHRDYVLRVARRFAGDDDLALDATQETFIYLLSKFPPPRHRRLTLTARLTTLLYPAAKHNALAARAKKTRLRLQPQETTPEPAADDGPAFADEHDLGAVLGRLSGDHREAVLLRFVDGLTVPEVAERLGVPVGTAKSRLHHAVAQLRDDPATKKYFEID